MRLYAKNYQFISGIKSVILTYVAKAVFADLDTSEGRSLRKRSAPPPAKDATPPMKKTSTMARTAKVIFEICL